jgi:hypothetical protein
VVAGLDQVRAELSARGAGRVGAALLVVVVLSCDRPASSQGSGAIQSAGATPGRVVDSLLPPEEALRRFRVGLDTPAALDGPRSRDELVRRFVLAVQNKDRAALDSLLVTRAEYAYLVFPELRISRPPYDQPPEIAWILTSAATNSGLSKLLGRTDRFQFGEYRCGGSSQAEGQLRVWSDCMVDLSVDGERRAARLFGAIIERDGRYKFAGFANDL